jgi:hypothetical protein
MKTIIRLLLVLVGLPGASVLPASADPDCVWPCPGLVGWWPGEGNARDIFGGHPGLWSNGVTFAAGMVGSAFSFDGTNGVISSASAPLTGIMNSFTFEFWVLPTASRASTTPSTKGTAGTSGQRYAIAPEYGGNAGSAGVGVSVGTNGVSVFEHAADYMPSPLVHPVAITQWTHVAVVYANKQPRLYLNGVLVKTGLTSPRSSVFPSKRFGNINSYGAFAGGLDEVSLYNQALASDEIAAIFAAGSAGKGKPPQPAPPAGDLPKRFRGRPHPRMVG